MAARVSGGGGGVGRVKHELDDALAAGGDVGFAADDGAVFHARGDGDVGRGGGNDVAAGGEDFGGEVDGLGEVAGHFGERGDEEVAEAVAFQFAAGAEAMAEETGDEALVFREGDHAVAEVPGGEHIEVAAEAAAGAAIVGDGNHRGEVGDEGRAGGRREESNSVGNAELEATQERGEACSTADGDDAQARGNG